MLFSVHNHNTKYDYDWGNISLLTFYLEFGDDRALSFSIPIPSWCPRRIQNTPYYPRYEDENWFWRTKDQLAMRYKPTDKDIDDIPF